jgi:hypothetical protein
VSKKYFAITCFILSTMNYIYCQNDNLLQYYDNEIIKMNYHSFGGIQLYNQEQTSSITFGISPYFREKLETFPESKMSFEQYKIKNISGNILVWGGLVVIVGGEYYSLNSIGESSFSSGIDKYMKGYGIMLGGLLMEVIGAFVLPSSFNDLFNSVNLYNRNIIKQYSNK